MEYPPKPPTYLSLINRPILNTTHHQMMPYNLPIPAPNCTNCTHTLTSSRSGPKNCTSNANRHTSNHTGQPFFRYTPSTAQATQPPVLAAPSRIVISPRHLNATQARKADRANHPSAQLANSTKDRHSVGRSATVFQPNARQPAKNSV